MSIIKQALQMFIRRYKPQKMSFIAEGDAKANIYLTFFKGYDIQKEESGLDSLSGKTPYLFKTYILHIYIAHYTFRFIRRARSIKRGSSRRGVKAGLI